jgi:hypothetical protein
MLGDLECRKIMHFQNHTSNMTLSICTLHGILVVLSSVISGADKCNGVHYWHSVACSAGTCSVGLQLDFYCTNEQLLKQIASSRKYLNKLIQSRLKSRNFSYQNSWFMIQNISQQLIVGSVLTLYTAHPFTGFLAF